MGNNVFLLGESRKRPRVMGRWALLRLPSLLFVKIAIPPGKGQGGRALQDWMHLPPFDFVSHFLPLPGKVLSIA